MEPGTVVGKTRVEGRPFVEMAHALVDEFPNVHLERDAVFPGRLLIEDEGATLFQE